MKILDIIVPVIVFIVAIAYLCRVFFIKKGCSCGNSSCSAAQGKNTIKNLQDNEDTSCQDDCCCSK